MFFAWKQKGELLSSDWHVEQGLNQLAAGFPGYYQCQFMKMLR